VVSGSSGLFATQVAEQTLALLLGLLRRIPQFHSAQQLRHYERRPTDDLCGKTVGILGLGLNGQQIARVLRPFNVKLIGCDLFPEASAGEVDFPVLPHTASVELFRRSDVIIAALPLTPDTRYFINVGRGQTVNEKELGQALLTGQLAGAGLDVVAVEPLPKHSEAWTWPNLLLTPHVGAQSASRYQTVTDFFVENLRRWQTGGTLLNLVDKRLGFPLPEHRLRLPRRIG
jgi:D-3-phosphoglycerate dehydrogenase